MNIIEVKEDTYVWTINDKTRTAGRELLVVGQTRIHDDVNFFHY